MVPGMWNGPRYWTNKESCGEICQTLTERENMKETTDKLAIAWAESMYDLENSTNRSYESIRDIARKGADIWDAYCAERRKSLMEKLPKSAQDSRKKKEE